MRRNPRECAQVAPLLTAREGELAADERARVDLHLAGCAPCRALAADFAATEGLVADALLAAAARRDFAPFVDAVMERVEVGRAPAVPGRLGGWARLRAWARRHRAAALAGTLAPTLAAAALIVYLSTSRTAAPLAGEVEVFAEGRVPLVLQTSEGPVVLLDEPGGT